MNAPQKQQPDSPLTGLRNYLVEHDYDVPADPNDFEGWVQQDGRLARLHKVLQADTENVEVAADYNQFEAALGLKKKSGGSALATGGVETGTATDVPQGQPAPGQQAGDLPFGTVADLSPQGLSLPGVIEAPQYAESKVLPPSFVGPEQPGTYEFPSDKGTAAEGTRYVGPQPGSQEAADVADDGFWATFGKSLYNGLDWKRVVGNLTDYVGDLNEMQGRLGAYGGGMYPVSNTGPGYAAQGATREQLAAPLSNNKSTDLYARDLLQLATDSDLPLSEAARQSMLQHPSRAALGSLLGSGVASIVPVAAASAIGGPGAGAAIGAGIGISATKETARAAGVGDQEATITATALAPIQAVLEAAGVQDPGVARLAVGATIREAIAATGGRVTAQALSQAARQVLPEVVKRVASQGGREALTELLQGEAEGASQLLADRLRPEGAPGGYGVTPMQALVTNPLEQAIAGFALGGGLGLTHGGTETARPVEVAGNPQPGTFDVVRPGGEVQMRDVQVVSEPDAAGKVLVRGKNAQGETVQERVNGGWVYPTRQTVAEAADPAAQAPAKAAPAEPDPQVVDVTGALPEPIPAAQPAAPQRPTQVLHATIPQQAGGSTRAGNPDYYTALALTPTGDGKTATFTFSDAADQQFFTHNGASQLSSAFDYATPNWQADPQTIRTLEPGEAVRNENGEWRITKKARIQVGDDTQQTTPLAQPVSASNLPTAPVEPQPSPTEPSAPIASPSPELAGEPAPIERLPDAQPANPRTLTTQEQAQNSALDTVDRYNALSGTERRSKAGQAARREAVLAAGKAGMTLADQNGKLVANLNGKRATRANEYTATSEAANHVPLSERPAEVREFTEKVLTAAEQNISTIQGLGLNMRGKALTARELEGAVADVRAGKNTLRAQSLLDTLENAHREGVVYKSEGTGLATRKYAVPVGEFVGDVQPQVERQAAPLADAEIDQLLADSPEVREAVDDFIRPDGSIDYAALAETARDPRGGSGGLQFLYNLDEPTANRLKALADERARTTADRQASPPSQAAAEPGGEAQGGTRPDGVDRRGQAPGSAAEAITPESAAPLTLAEQNAQAKQEFNDALAEFRAARKKGSGTAQSSLLGIPAFSPEEAAALTKMAKAAIKLGAIKTKQVVARLRAQGLTDDDATDEQLRPFVKQLLTQEGLRQPKRTLPPNEPEGGATRASMARLDADPTQPDALKQRIRDTGLDKYEPKSLAETEQAVDSYMARNSLADAYAEAISASDNLSGDVRTALRVRVLKAVSQQLTEALDRGDAASADAYLEQAEKVTEAIAKRGTDAGREINAYKVLATLSPEATVYKAQKEVQAQRKQREKQLAGKVVAERKRVVREKAKALDAALSSAAVAKAREVVTQPRETTRPTADPAGYGEKNRYFTKQGLSELRQRLKSMAFVAPLPPDLVYLGAYHLEASTRKFADWSKKVVRDAGERVRPRLPELYEEARKALLAKGAPDTGFDNQGGVDAALRQELADNLADRILAKVRPVKPGQFDPVQQMLDTLARRASEDLPANQRKPKPAREALAQAINNRREYQKVLQESRTAVLDKIADLKVSGEAKQRMVDDLTDFIDQVNDRPYAEQQFNRALRQAEDEVLPRLGGTRLQQYDNLAKLPEAEYERVVKELQAHVTQGIAVTDTEASELRDAIANELNRRVLSRRRVIRARNGVFEEGQQPAPSEATRRTLPERVAELLAARATPQQIAERFAPQTVREGIKDLGRTLDQIARDHLTDPAAVGKSLAQQFVERAGLPEAQAQTYAEAIEKEFSRRIADSRQRQLDRLAKRAAATPQKRASKTDLDRTMELFALSATDDNAILDHLKRVNDLPELTAQDVADLRKLAEKVRDAPEGFQKDEAVENLLKAQAKIKGVKLADIGQALWYANVLSGYKTHAINLTANLIQTGSELGIHTAYAVGAGRGRYATAGAKGLARGLARGAREAVSVLTTGRETSRTPDKYEVPGILENIRFAGGAANPANYLKYVNRALRAGDVLFSSGLKEMRAHDLAVKYALEDAKSDGDPSPNIWARAAEKLYNTKQRLAEARTQAEAEGLKGNDLERRIYEIAEQSRDAAMMEDAREYGTRAVFNGDVKGALGWVATGVQNITNGIDIGGFKPAKFVVPFTRVITNVANAYLDYTPVGFGRAARGGHLFGGNAESKMQRPFSAEERWKTGIKAVVGTSVAAAAYALSNNKDKDGKPTFEMTGFGTGNPARDAQLRADGWQPYSIKVGDTWYSYANHPLAIMLAGVGSYNDGVKYGGEKADDQSALDKLGYNSFRALQFTKDMTALKGAADFLSAVDSRNPGEITRWVQRLAAGSAKGYVPFSGLLTQTAKDYQALSEQAKKQGRTFTQMLVQDIPAARNSVNDALDVLGDPLPVDTDRLFSSPPHRDQQTQRIWNWLNKNELFISVPNRNSGGALVLRAHQGKETPMTEDEYFRFMQERGHTLKGLLQASIVDLEKLDQATARRVLRKYATAANTIAKARVFGGAAVPVDERPTEPDEE